MNSKQLERISQGEGFIAALDQSGGSTPNALQIYGIAPTEYQNDEEMFEKVHTMRTRIIQSPAFSSDHILGAILFENTMERMINNQFTADYLWEVCGIVPFLKIDQGLAEEVLGVQRFKPMPNLDSLLKRAREHHIFGTKERSLIKLANEEGISILVQEQCQLAKKVFDTGFIPIIEPEVDIRSPEKEEAEAILLAQLQIELAKLPASIKVMLKLSLPTIDNLYAPLLKNPKVIRIVALSGGYSQKEANARLSRNQGVIASFSRALSEGLLVTDSDARFNEKLAHSIDAIYRASIK